MPRLDCPSVSAETHSCRIRSSSEKKRAQYIRVSFRAVGVPGFGECRGQEYGTHPLAEPADRNHKKTQTPKP